MTPRSVSQHMQNQHEEGWSSPWTGSFAHYTTTEKKPFSLVASTLSPRAFAHNKYLIADNASPHRLQTAALVYSCVLLCIKLLQRSIPLRLEAPPSFGTSVSPRARLAPKRPRSFVHFATTRGGGGNCQK